MPTMEMDRAEQAMKAGKRLREMRTSRGWTALDIEKKTRAAFGAGREINETQNGRIERGAIERISFEDAMKLARVYEITPQEMAQIFGLWPENAADKHKPRELTAAELMYNTLEDEGDRAMFLTRIGFEVANQRALLRMRAKGLGKTPQSQSEWGKYRSSEE
jgi:transcriptional regulator with XRE-family HTH domain